VRTIVHVAERVNILTESGRTGGFDGPAFTLLVPREASTGLLFK
jgi:hypothetical protein